jgi:hypothetical protein
MHTPAFILRFYRWFFPRADVAIIMASFQKQATQLDALATELEGEIEACSTQIEQVSKARRSACVEQRRAQNAARKLREFID